MHLLSRRRLLDLAGIKVDRIRTLGWAIAGAAGAAAGMLQTPMEQVRCHLIHLISVCCLFFGFIAAVIGGLDSLIGAVIGGVVLGLVLAFVLTYISGSLVFITAFALLIVVLLIRPQGLVAVKRGRRA